MDKLINDLNSAFHKARNKGVPITHPSIPILFFGDLAKYRNSDLKVITVGLNPSHIEFPTHSRFTRFLDAESLDTSKKWSGPEVTTYLHSLSEYFKHNPYSWFDSFESILNARARLHPVSSIIVTTLVNSYKRPWVPWCSSKNMTNWFIKSAFYSSSFNCYSA